MDITAVEVEDQYLTFVVADDSYAIDISYIKDIIQMRTVKQAQVPGVPPYIIGITNLRGTIIPVVDVRIRFGKEHREYNERTCIVVVVLDDMQIGMIVEEVREVLKIPEHSITPPPKTSAASENRYVQNIASVGENNEIILLLDVEKLFYDSDPNAGEGVYGGASMTGA